MLRRVAERSQKGRAALRPLLRLGLAPALAGLLLSHRLCGRSRCGRRLSVGCLGSIGLCRVVARAEIQDRVGDDVVRADLRATLGLVFAGAELTFDAEVRALLERCGIFTQLAPHLDAVPFGPLLALVTLQERGLSGEREGRNSLPVRRGF